jgi:hypothetical protein
MQYYYQYSTGDGDLWCALLDYTAAVLRSDAVCCAMLNCNALTCVLMPAYSPALWPTYHVHGVPSSVCLLFTEQEAPSPVQRPGVSQGCRAGLE